MIRSTVTRNQNACSKKLVRSLVMVHHVHFKEAKKQRVTHIDPQSHPV